jgi:serine/threonine-protein kinase haspin
MRSFVYTGNPLDETRPPVITGIWSEFIPKTNLIWLLFILKMLLKSRLPEPVSVSSTKYSPTFTSPHKRPPLTACPSKGNIKKSVSDSTKKEQAIKENPAAIPALHSILQSRQHHLLKQTPQHIDEQLERDFSVLQHDLSKRLNTVLDLLDLEHGRDDMCCAADLVAYAIDVGWLDQRDFFLS